MLHFLYHSIFLFHDTVFLSFPATCMGYLPIKLLKMEAMFFLLFIIILFMKHSLLWPELIFRNHKSN